MVLVNVFFFLFASINIALAKWTSTNPGGGGAFNSPVITKEGIWAVGSDLGGLYISQNTGKSWYPVGSSNGLTATHVSSLATHPAARLIIGTDSGIFISTSKGTKVRHVFEYGYVAALVVSPADPSIAYAAIHEVWNGVGAIILRSKNGGQKWRRIGFVRDMRALALRPHPTISKAVWLVSGEGRFAESAHSAHISKDGGKSWKLAGAPGRFSVVDVAYAPSSPRRMYMSTASSTGGRFFVSLNAGKTWRRRGGIVQPGVLIAHRKKPNLIRMIDTMQGTLLVSSNSGKSWTRTPLSVSGGWSQADEDWGMTYSFQGQLHTIAHRIDKPNALLWVNPQFVFKSSNGGKSWSDAVSLRSNSGWKSRGIDNVVPLVVAPSANGRIVYAGYMDLGLWRSTDGGKSWENMNRDKWSYNWGGKGGNTLTIATDPSLNEVAWAQVAGDIGDGSHLIKTKDGGKTWWEMSSGLPKRPRFIDGLEVAPNSLPGLRWIFVIVDGDVYLSQNDGSTWEKVLNCGDCVIVRYTFNNGVIAAGPSGVFRSWRGGRGGSWDSITMMLSEEMRGGWTKGQHWLDDHWSFSGPVDIAWKGKKDLWIAVRGAGKGLYYSKDFAQTWTKVFDNSEVWSVTKDKGGKVLVGSSSALAGGGFNTESEGVQAHKNGKRRQGWKAMNAGLAYPFATRVVVGRDGSRWCISPGQGVMRWE